MCENDDFDALVQYHCGPGPVARQFGALSMGAGLLSLVPAARTPRRPPVPT